MTLARDVRKCEACGIATRRWHTLAVKVDGRPDVEVPLCVACLDTVRSAVRVILEHRERMRR